MNFFDESFCPILSTETKRKQIRIIWAALGVKLKIDFKINTILNNVNDQTKVSIVTNDYLILINN